MLNMHGIYHIFYETLDHPNLLPSFYLANECVSCDISITGLCKYYWMTQSAVYQHLLCATTMNVEGPCEGGWNETNDNDYLCRIRQRIKVCPLFFFLSVFLYLLLCIALDLGKSMHTHALQENFEPPIL